MKKKTRFKIILILLLFYISLMFLLSACGFSGAYEKRLSDGEEYLAARDYTAAMAAYREAAALRRNRPEGYLGIGDVYLALASMSDPWSVEQDMNLKGALENYQKALEAGGNRVQSRSKLIAYYLFLGDQASGAENQWAGQSDALPRVARTDAGIPGVYIIENNNNNNLNETDPENEAAGFDGAANPDSANDDSDGGAEMNIHSIADTGLIARADAGRIVMDSEKGVSVTDEQGNLISLRELAESCYQSALEIDISDIETRLRYAAFLEARGRQEEAIKILRDGLAYHHDEALSGQIEQIQLAMERAKEDSRRASASRILSAAPYYGSIEKCRMDRETAIAYAQLLSDGLTGKFKGFSGYGQPLYDYPVYWDEPYPVIGYGSYETDRARVFLGDFGADGYPCLILISSLVENGSFEIYGRAENNNNKISLLTGEESGMKSGIFLEREDGSIILEKVLTQREDFRSGETWRFRNGAGGVSQVWEEAWDAETRTMRVTRNGTTLEYTRDQWNAQRQSEENQVNQNGLTPLKEIIAKSCPLRDMMRYLNAYAAALSDDDINNNINNAAEIPPEHPQRHKMAVAMLRKLYELEHLSIDTDTRLCAVRLGDLNNDGAEELFAAFTDEYETANGTLCQFVIYEWRNGGLSEIPGGNDSLELRLVKDKNTDETGILGTGTINDVPGNNNNNQERYLYVFLSRTLELRRDKNAGRYEIVRDGGQPAGITTSEYTALKNLYAESDLLVNYNRPVELNHNSYAQIVSALYQIRDAA